MSYPYSGRKNESVLFDLCHAQMASESLAAAHVFYPTLDVH